MDVFDFLAFSVLIIVSINTVPCEAVTLDKKVDILSNRLSLLDSKVSLDLISLRQDLEEVKKIAIDASNDGVRI